MATFDPSGGGFAAVGVMLGNNPVIEIFAAFPDGLFQTWYNEDTGGWNLVPGAATPTLSLRSLAATEAAQSFTHAPSVTSWAPGRLDVFAVSAAGDLWHFWEADQFDPPSQWGAESLGHPAHGPLDSAPSAVAQDVDKITVFARDGREGALNACVWDPANGQRWVWASNLQLGWAAEPSPYAFSPAACSWDPSRIDLFAISGNADDYAGGKVMHSWQQDFPGNPGWHPDYWESVADSATSSPVAVSWLDQQGVQQITTVYCGSSTIEGSNVGMTRWLGDHFEPVQLYAQSTADDGIAGFPTLASWGPGRLDVFWMRSDNTLQHGWNASGGDPAAWDWTDHFALQLPGQ